MSRNVPGHIGYPIIGDKSIEFASDPVAFVEKRIEHHSSRVFQCRVLNNPSVFLCSPHLIQELLTEKSKDFEHGYRSLLHRVYGDLIIFEDECDVEEIRHCLAPVFADPLNYKKTIDGLCLPFIDSFKTRCGDFKVYEEFKSFMTKFCLELFLDLDTSTPLDVVDEISSLATQHWHGIISVPVSLRLPVAGRSTFNLALEARQRILEHIRTILAGNGSSSRKNGDSVLSRLMRATFPSEKALEQHLLLFVSAVIPKAFASIITSFIVAMAGDEKASMRSRARTDPHYLSNALLEVERMWPPLFAGRRLAKRATTLGNYIIPKDYALFYVAQSAHRDENTFPRPNTFEPNRWTTCNKQHKDLIFTFGSGHRQCIGTKFIRTILYDVITSLLQNYDWFLSPPGQDVTYKYLPVARPDQPITVRFEAVQR